MNPPWLSPFLHVRGFCLPTSSLRGVDMLRHLLLVPTVCLLGLSAVPSSAMAEDIVDQSARQRETQAETDFTVRRLQTYLRVMSFYQADKSTQKRTMEEMAQ